MTTNLVDYFQTDIEAVIDKYRDQGLAVAEAIGTIEIVKLNLWNESNGHHED